ncbi:MAG: pantetheine-phosphate adenylyltransferase [Christensenellales bacterium]|jgi:pantetheine-phosphate adenylyltransferase
MSKSVCVYPGTFDPFTLGHLDILCRAAKIFQHVTVGILNNIKKTPTFTVEERIFLIEQAAKGAGISNFSVKSFDGLLVDFCREQGAGVIIRGLRAVSDYEYELQIAAMNRRLAPEVETLCMMTDAKYAYLSSSIVREIGSYGGSLKGMIPPETEDYISERLLKK